MRSPLKLLLDTNVLLDEYLPDRPTSKASRELIRRAQERGDCLLYPARVIVDVHYQIAATFKAAVRAEKGVLSDADAAAIQEIAWGCIENLEELATPVGMDVSDVWVATKYRRFNRDFEDCFIMAAAGRAQADYIVTSDHGLIGKSTVAALTPDDMLALLAAEEE
jgi:predicted nucleic acid-binding protein